MNRMLSAMAYVFRSAFSRLGAAISLHRHRGQGLGSASPSILVKNVLRAADGASIAWDDSELLYPNSILIFIGYEPWNAYYSKMLGDSQDRIATRLQGHIRMQGGASMQVSVRIGLDPLLQGTQTRIETSFNESIADPTRTPVLFLNNKDEHDRMKTQVMFGQANEHIVTTPLANKEREPPIPQKEPIAYVTFGHLRYEVRDGTTIGVLRYSDRERADITLPREKCPGVSHVHGSFQFSKVANAWSYENIGRNGTTIIRKDVMITLNENESTALHGGDCLQLATEATKICFEAR